jgi:tetratricopeptide (TPR) repeat protein
VWVLGIWGVSAGFCGDFAQGERLLEKAESFAKKIDHKATIGVAHYGYGTLLAVKGEGHVAAEHHKLAITHIQESQTMIFLGQAWAWLGYPHCLMGQPEIAIDLTEKGLKIHAENGLPFWRSQFHWFCSYAQFEHGRMEKAGTHAEQALKLSLSNNEKNAEGVSRAWLGRVLAKADAAQVKSAELYLLQGIRLLEELGAMSYVCLGYLWLGEVYAESGRREDALESLKKAEGMFRDMGMDYWLGKAQKALARL